MKQHHVVHNPNGGWDVKTAHAQRASAHSATKAKAISLARTISQNQGSELFIHKRNNYIALLNQHIDDLFNRVISFVEQINTKLETGKYQISRKKPYGQTTRQSLTVSLAEKSFSFEFLDYSIIPLNENQRKKESIEWQRQQFGFVMQSYEGSYFTKNNIVLIGLAETSFKIKDFEFGFNLFLKKPENSNYGEWYVYQVSENCSPPKTPSGLPLNQFFDAYQKFKHNPFFTKKEWKLEDKDILDLIHFISN